MRERFGDKVRLPIVPFGGGGWLRRRLGLSLAACGPMTAGPLLDLAGLRGQADFSLGADLVSTLEARALWARFGF